MFPSLYTFIFTIFLVGFVNCHPPADSVLVFNKGEGGYYCHKIPYLYRTYHGTLIALAEGRGKYGRDACDDFAGTDLVYKRSVDNGATWSPINVLWTNSSTTEFNVLGNAAPVQDISTGRIWIPFCRNNEEVFITYSDDDGESWSPPVHHPELVLGDWKWVGLGPPAGIQLSSGRLLIPSYHTTLWKGDGCASRGHTLYSDDHGVTWAIGSAEFGAPFLSNECQAVELRNGSVLINARVVSTHRIQVVSDDGGLSFGPPSVVNGLSEPIEGCEGSTIGYNGGSGPAALFYSGPYTDGLFRRNMSILTSRDEGLNWYPVTTVDRGAVSYSALQVIPANEISDSDIIGLLYERSDSLEIVFEPDEIRFWKYPVPAV
mmetsp:Transcript_8571/g.12794  ORF Transcript_8571/g.12794 Transcript_8571/m.12794 type:complete len:374 (+) Transcript_8571:32-1153(+)